MLKELLLAANAPKQRVSGQAFSALKSELNYTNRVLGQARRRLKDNKDFDQFSRIIDLSTHSKSLKKEYERMKDALSDKVVVDFGNVKIKTKKSYIKRLKDPEGYVYKRYTKRTLSQITKGKEAGRSTKGLERKLETTLKDYIIAEIKDGKDLHPLISAFHTLLTPPSNEPVEDYEVVFINEKGAGIRLVTV